MTCEQITALQRVMERRWPATLITLIGAGLVLGLQVVNEIGDAMPFATAYHPRWSGLVHFAGAGMLAGTLVFARRAGRRHLWIDLGVTVVIALAAVAAYAAYHAHHVPPRVPDGFRGHLVTVTAFHEQLAAPVFATLGFTAAILTTVQATGNRTRTSC